MSAPAFVYFVQAGGAIKIGFSTNVEQRLAMLQTDSPVELELLASIAVSSVDDARDMEAALHDNFSDLRIRGEWFASDPRIADVIAALKLAERMKSKDRIGISAGPRPAAVACSVDPDAFVVEWSHRQGHSHIQTVGTLIECNRDMLLTGQGEPNDYAVIGVFSSREEANEFAEAVEPRLRAARIARMCRGDGGVPGVPATTQVIASSRTALNANAADDDVVFAFVRELAMRGELLSRRALRDLHDAPIPDRRMRAALDRLIESKRLALQGQNVCVPDDATAAPERAKDRPWRSLPELLPRLLTEGAR